MEAPILGVTLRFGSAYNWFRSAALISGSNKLNACAGALNLVRGVGVGDPWSRPISTRAESKLSPCMARPNLFSGD